MPDLTIRDAADLASVDAGATVPLSQNPAVVYVLSLSAGSQRTMRQSLDTMAQLLGYPDLEHCPWSALRAQHTSVLRGLLQQGVCLFTMGASRLHTRVNPLRQVGPPTVGCVPLRHPRPLWAIAVITGPHGWWVVAPSGSAPSC